MKQRRVEAMCTSSCSEEFSTEKAVGHFCTQNLFIFAQFLPLAFYIKTTLYLNHSNLFRISSLDYLTSNILYL